MSFDFQPPRMGIPLKSDRPPMGCLIPLCILGGLMFLIIAAILFRILVMVLTA